MKRTITISTYLLLQFLYFAPSSYSQSDEILDNFSAFENDGKVYLNWTVTSGSTCDGIVIFHSIDEINFERIGDIPGICGSSSEPVSYSFVHESPLQNGINLYRLQLGLIGFSDVVSVTLIETKEAGYNIYPNPIVENSILYFKNPRKQISLLRIYDQFGKYVTNSSAASEQFNLNTAEYPAGTYFFSITGGDNIQITGKFILLKK